MKRIVFVCVHNAGRSQVAEAFAKHYGQGAFEVYSAGSTPGSAIHSVVTEAMQEKGIELTGQTPKGLDQLPKVSFDALVTMGCGDACPSVTATTRIDWQLPDPKDLSIEEVRKIRDIIEEKVSTLLETLRHHPSA